MHWIVSLLLFFIVVAVIIATIATFTTRAGGSDTADHVQSTNSHIIHCLEQVIRFAKMLDTNDASRNRDAVIGQLSFNWGRYTELAATDGRSDWRFLEAALSARDYNSIRERGDNLLGKYKK